MARVSSHVAPENPSFDLDDAAVFRRALRELHLDQRRRWRGKKRAALAEHRTSYLDPTYRRVWLARVLWVHFWMLGAWCWPLARLASSRAFGSLWLWLQRDARQAQRALLRMLTREAVYDPLRSIGPYTIERHTLRESFPLVAREHIGNLRLYQPRPRRVYCRFRRHVFSEPFYDDTCYETLHCAAPECGHDVDAWLWTTVDRQRICITPTCHHHLLTQVTLLENDLSFVLRPTNPAAYPKGIHVPPVHYVLLARDPDASADNPAGWWEAGSTWENLALIPEPWRQCWELGLARTHWEARLLPRKVF